MVGLAIRLCQQAPMLLDDGPSDGVYALTQHRNFAKPNSVTISHDTDGRWWLSFNFDDGVDANGEQVDAVRRLAGETDAEIASSVIGHDVGVVRAVTSSDGKFVTFADAKLARIARWNKRLGRLQKHLARKVKGSGKARKAKRRIARIHSKIGDLRNDHAHQVSRVIADGPCDIIAFERLKLRNMNRRPKPVCGKTPGSFAPNGAAAKRGLNKSLLNAALGKIVTYACYKAARLGKIVVRVPAANSSRECSRCHHTSPDNRKTQAQFHCMACGHTDNADANASVIVAQRATSLIFSVLGRSTQITPEEAAETLGLSKTLLRAAVDPGFNSSNGSTHLAA